MLLLSRMTGLEVRGPGGVVLGHVADMTARLGVGGTTAVVDRILVDRNRQPAVLVPWTGVQSFRPPVIELSSDGASFEVPKRDGELHGDEIRLVRDVLDTQIVDIAGQRLARVADVVLAHRADGHLELVGVEVGFGAVLRRLGIGRLASRARGDAVAWADLHLTSERGHAVQLRTPRSAIHLLDARGLATVIARLDTDSAAELLATKDPAVAAEVITASQPEVGKRVARAMSESTSPLGDRHYLRSHIWPRRRHTLRKRQ